MQLTCLKNIYKGRLKKNKKTVGEKAKRAIYIFEEKEAADLTAENIYSGN